jgi:hypothetical protein
MEINEARRLEIIETLATRWTAEKNKQDLALYFYESQVDFLASLQDDFLYKIAKDEGLNIED